MKRSILLALAVGLLFGACAPAQTNLPATAPLLPIVARNQSAQLPSQTALPPTLTSTPTPALMVEQGTPYPRPAEAIAPENAAQVVPLVRWGKGAVNYIVLSPDGTTLAAAGSLGIYLYAADTLEQQRFLPADVSLNCLAFSPDGQTLASGSNDGVLVWDLASGQVRNEMGGDGHDYVNALAFSPDGKLLASGTSYATIDMWNPASGQLVYSLSWDPYYWTDALAFSPDGKFLASGQYAGGYHEGVIVLWDMSTGEQANIYEEQVRTAWAGTLAFSPDSLTVAFANGNESVTLWDTAANTATQALAHQPAHIHSVAVSPDGSSLAVGTQDGDILLWDIASGKILHTLHTEGGTVNSLAFSEDGRTLYSGSGDGLRLWDTAGGTLLLSNLDHAPLGAVLSFSPDGRRLATVTASVVTIWDAASGSSLQEYNGGKYATISPDWSLLSAVSTEDRGILLLYDLSSGQMLREWSHDSNNAEISGMAFSPDGRILAQVEYSFRNVLLLWSMPGGGLLRVIQGDHLFADAIAITPDGRTLATTESILVDSPNGNIQFWDVASGAKMEALHVGESYIRALAFSPDGATLAVQTFASVTLWDRDSGALLQTLDQSNTNLMAFSPDGKVLAVGGWVGAPPITLWEVSTGAKLATLAGHNLETTGLAFSPDGRTLVSASEEGILLFWGLRP